MKRICIVLTLMSVAAIANAFAQDAAHKFNVKETRISREEFIEAYEHRSEYNQVRDTMLDWHIKKAVEVAAFRTLTDEEKEAYVWGDYWITNIGRYPSGEYVADLWYANWMGAVYLDKDFQIDTTIFKGSDRAAYSDKGIYVGCEGFDCDNHAWFHFYRHKDGKAGSMEEIAEYRNFKWSLPYHQEYPEFNGLESDHAMVWYKDALYCFGVEKYDENGKWTGRPIFMKLELDPATTDNNIIRKFLMDVPDPSNVEANECWNEDLFKLLEQHGYIVLDIIATLDPDIQSRIQDHLRNPIHDGIDMEKIYHDIKTSRPQATSVKSLNSPTSDAHFIRD